MFVFSRQIASVVQRIGLFENRVFASASSDRGSVIGEV
jgi:hypothetical protein